jgi:hypothetical protein
VLEAFDLGQPREHPPLLVFRERRPVPAGLDGLAQPDALLMVRDVLDLVGDRSAVGLPETGQDVGQRLALNADAEDGRRNARLQLGRELRDEQLRLERRVAHRLRPERIEVGGEMPVGAVCLDQRRRCGHGAEQRMVDGLGRRCRSRLGGRSYRLLCRRGGSQWGRTFAVGPQRLQQARKAGQRLQQLGVAALEHRAPLGRNGLGVLEVLLEEATGVADVHPIDVVHAHQVLCISESPSRRVW